MKKKTCPKCKSEPAIIHPVYGIIWCKKCQAKDRRERLGQKYEFATLSRSHRIQAERDKHGADFLQPFISNKPNVDFFKNYPSKVKEYGVEKELAKL